MNLLEQQKLSNLRGEKEKFEILLRTLDRQVSTGEITSRQKKFTINNITQGLSEQEYLKILEEKIAFEESKNKKTSTIGYKNIIIISVMLMITIMLLAIFIIPELYSKYNQQTKESIIHVNKTYYSTDSKQYPLNIIENSKITSLKINGTYTGDVRIYLISNITKQRYLVFDSKKYDTNTISITGNLVIIRGDPEKTGTSINNLCDETCSLQIDPQGAYLEIEVENQGFVYLKDITYDQIIINHAPLQIKDIPDITIIENSANIDLTEYFSDIDNDKIIYKISNIPELTTTIKENIITFKTEQKANKKYTGFIYVSDGKEEINSNTFKIIVNNTELNKTYPNITAIKRPVNNSAINNTLPFVKTNKTLDLNLSQTENKTENDTTIKSNNTIEINTTINNITKDNNINTTINKLIKNINNNSKTTIPKTPDFSKLTFETDSLLKQLFTVKPYKQQRIIIEYKSSNYQTTTEYLEELKTELEQDKNNNPKEYNLTQLEIDKKIIEDKIAQLKSQKNTKEIVKNNYLTGQIVVETESIKDLETQLNEINSKLEKIETYDNLEKTKIIVTKIDKKSKIEVITANAEEILLLKNNKNIKGVYLDDTTKMLMQESIELTQILEAKVYPENILEGENELICLLDTGVNNNIITNIISGYNFVDNNNDYLDNNGHGTSIGYIINNIVPESKLIIGKVLNDSGTGYESTILAGLQYCVDNNATIISMSLGSGGYNGYCDENIVAQKVNELNANGIIVVAATGNDATTLVKVPACASGAISVGASTKEDTLTNFTTYNGNTLILAPGKNINTIDKNGNPKTVSGTSIAVPFVTTTIAILKQNEQTLTPIEIKNRIIHTGKLIETENQSFSRLNAYNAITNNITNNLTELGNNGTGNISEYKALSWCSDWTPTGQSWCDSQDCCGWNGAIDECEPASGECRPSAGTCDVAESCGAPIAECPSDAGAGTGTVCETYVYQGNYDWYWTCSGLDYYFTSRYCSSGDRAGCSGSTGLNSWFDDCDDYNECTNDYCTSGYGNVCSHTNKAGTACTGSSNGGACDTTDTCSGGSCIDNYLSAAFVCRSSTGSCDITESCTGSSGACPGNSFVSAGTWCSSGANYCSGLNVYRYENGCHGGMDFCHSSYYAPDTFIETCTDDYGVCGYATCTGAGNCGNTATGGACNDGNDCTYSDTCSGGSCGGTSYSCNSPPECYTTPGTCNGYGGCSYTLNNGASCNDGNSCTYSDSCSGGSCSGTSYSCNSAGTCYDNPGTCNGGGGCSYSYTAYGTYCSAGSNYCNGLNVYTYQYGCSSGSCVDGAYGDAFVTTCPDSWGVCGDATCTGAGSCGNTAVNNGGLCSTGSNYCNGGQLYTQRSGCSAGTCDDNSYGDLLIDSCDDGNACTTDGCTGSSCTHTNNANLCRGSGGTCDPAEYCSGGGCPGDSRYSGDYCSGCYYCDGTNVGCQNIPAGNDYYGDCTDSGWNICDAGYQCRKSNDGNCNGGGACTSTTTTHVSDGYVCSGGTCNANPSGTTNCDTTINCATNACTAAMYYRGYAGAGVSCSETNKQSAGTWNEPTSGYVTSETTYKVGTSCTTTPVSCSNYCSWSGYNACSAQTPYGTVTGCGANTGACNGGTTTCTTTGCSGAESNRCVSGSCTNQCSDASDNDGDGYTDAQDTDCGGCGQCTSGTCCTVATGCFKSAGTVCLASAGTCDVQETCTGSSTACPADAGTGTGTICSSNAYSRYTCAAQTPYLQYADRYCAAGDRAGCTGAQGSWKKPGTAQTACTNLCNTCSEGSGTCAVQSCTLTGTTSTVSKRTVYKYTSGTGTFTMPSAVADAQILVVAGGGGGGMDMGGGGGGGGVIATSYSTTPGSITITVGPGGSGAPAGSSNVNDGGHQFYVAARNGQNSVFGTQTAIGGGFGGSSYRAYTPGITGGNGGSGGGSSGYNDNAGTFYGGTGTAGQGNRGGNSIAAYYSGGGGGAGAQGADSTSQPDGGIGVSNSILGTSYYWGGGGGGASYSLGTGGNGGAGGGGGGAVGTTTGGSGLNAGSAGGGGSPNSQTNTPGGNGGANTGGGGGGGSHYNANNYGGDGGSGIVVVSLCMGCYIGGVCYDNGDVNGGNGCQKCNTALSQTAWSNNPVTCRASGGACDSAETCSGGSCPSDSKLSGKQSCTLCTHCDGSNNACQNVGAGADTYTECTDSGWNACDNSYTCRKSNDGNCNGGGACTSTTTTHVSDGYVCSGGTCNANPSGTTNCDTTINCATNACSAARYYRGYAGTGVSCSETNKQGYAAWSASASNLIIETTYKVGSTCTESTATTGLYCSYASSCADGACSGTGYYRSCDGSGSCRSDNTGAATAAIYATAGYTLTAACGVTGTTLCGYSGYNQCSGQTPGRDQYRCQASGGACTYDVGDAYDGSACSGTCTNYCNSGTCGNRAAGSTNTAGGTCCDSHNNCAASWFCELSGAGGSTNNPNYVTCGSTEYPDLAESHCIQQGNYRTCEPSYDISRGYIVQNGGTDGYNSKTVGMGGNSGNYPYDWWGHGVGAQGGIGYKTTSADSTLCLGFVYDPCSAGGAQYYKTSTGTATSIGAVDQSSPAKGAGCNSYGMWDDLSSYISGGTFSTYQDAAVDYYTRQVFYGWKTGEVGATDGSNSYWCCESSTSCVDDAPAQGAVSEATGNCYGTTTYRNTGGGDGADTEQCRSGTWYAQDSDSTACTTAGNTWTTNAPISGGRCCNDDGASDNSYYYSAVPSSATSLTCERCNAGSYVAAATLIGNGNLQGSGTSRTCYYGDITCSAASGANGASTTVVGWGWNDASPATTSDTDFNCRSSAAICGNENAVDDSVTTLYGNGYTSSSRTAATSLLCYYSNPTCTDGSEAQGASGTYYGNGYYVGTLTTTTSLTCYYGDITCADENGASGTSTTLYGNGYATADKTTATSITCYYSDIVCGDNNAVNGANGVYYGNGYYSGSLTTSTSLTCYNGDITCADESAANGAGGTLYGNGYTAGNKATDTSLVCYYGDIVCGDSNAVNGPSGTYYGNGYKSGTTCYYADITCNDGTGANGASCTLTNANDACIADIGCLNQPTGLIATAQTDKILNSQLGKIILTWTDTSSTEDGFKIERSTDGITYSQINTVGASVATYTDDNLNDTQVYYYKIRSYKGSDNSEYSSVANTITIDRTKPSSSNLTVTADNTNNKIITNFTETDSGLLLYMPFEEGSGTVTQDWSANNNDGTITSATWTSGKYGNALSFDGSTSYVNINSVTGYANAITAEAWVKTSVSTGWKDVLAGGCGDLLFGVTSANTGVIGFGGQCNAPFVPLSSTTSISDNQWHHIAGTYDGSTAKIYIDGKLDNSGARSGTFTPGTLQISLSTEKFNGQIDDVRIYNRALSQREIANDMQSGLISKGLHKSTSVGGTYTPVNGAYDAFSSDSSSNYYKTSSTVSSDVSTWTISSGVLSVTNSGSGYGTFVYKNTTVKDFVFETDFYTGATHAGILWGAPSISATTQGYQWIIRDYADNNRIQKWTSDNNQLYLCNAANNLPSWFTTDTWYKLKLVIKDDYVNGYINNILTISCKHNDTTYLGSGYVGFTNYDSTTKYDNFTITQLIASNNYTDTTATDTTAPNQPSAPTVITNSNASVNISWSSVSDNGNSYYYYTNSFDYSGNNATPSSIQSTTVTTGVKDYYITGSGTGGNSYHTGTSTTITGLNCNTQYCYTITARDNALTTSSASTQTCAYTAACAAPKNSMIGSATSWTWGTTISGSSVIKSGNATNWTWRTYQENRPNSKTINGTGTNWNWVNE